MEGQFVSTLISLYNNLLANIALNIRQTNFIHFSSWKDNSIMVSKRLFTLQLNNFVIKSHQIYI